MESHLDPWMVEAVRQGVDQAMDMRAFEVYEMSQVLEAMLREIQMGIGELRALRQELAEEKEMEEMVRKRGKERQPLEEKLLQRLYRIVEQERKRIYQSLSKQFEERLQVLRKENEKLRRENLHLRERLRQYESEPPSP